MANIIQINGYAISSSNSGGGGSSFPYTGSAIISGSLIITGSTTSTLGFTGSLFGTASWANNVVSASFASTSSRLNADNTSISAVSSNRMLITASNGVIINAGTIGISLDSPTTVKGNLLPAGPYTNNTSSYSLGSPSAAWKDLYVSNGSVYFISGSNTASISFSNGNVNFEGANITIPSGSTVPTASFATNAANAVSASYVLNAVSASFTQTASYAQNVYAPSFITYSGGSQANSTTALADVHSSAGFDNLSVGFYEFEMFITYNAALTSTGARYSLSGSTSFDYLACDIGYSTSVSDRGAFQFKSFDGGTVAQSSAATTNNTAILQGHINTTSTGQLRLRFSSRVGGSAITVTDVTGFIRRL